MSQPSADYSCSNQTEEYCNEPADQIMVETASQLEPQSSSLLLPSLSCYTYNTTDILDNEFGELDYSSHPQSLEFLELSTPAPELEDDDANYPEVNNNPANNEPSINVPGACIDNLYKDSTITTSASSVIIMKYATKHNLTVNALADLLQLVKLHCPSPNNIPSTLFHFKKEFQELQYPVIYHYYCNACLMEASEDAQVCSNQECSTETNSYSSFIELPIGLQLKSILSRKCFY